MTMARFPGAIWMRRLSTRSMPDTPMRANKPESAGTADQPAQTAGCSTLRQR